MMTSVGVAGVTSLVILGIVGRKSYQRKVVQLTRELEKEGKGAKYGPPKVRAVLTPVETIKVFLVPMVYVLCGTTIVGGGVKKLCGIRDFEHGISTLKWVTKTGPPPS